RLAGPCCRSNIPKTAYKTPGWPLPPALEVAYPDPTSLIRLVAKLSEIPFIFSLPHESLDLSSRRRTVVRAHFRRAEPGPGGGVARNPGGASRAGRRADRVRENARRFPCGH